MPRLKTALTDTLAIDHPILLAPMAAVGGGALAAAVSSAGGLGLIGGGYCDPEWLRDAFRDSGNARVGVGFITWALDRQPDILLRALDCDPACIFLSFGDPTPHAALVKRAGVKLVCQVQTLDEARQSADLGADVIVAQGQEAGGHGRSGRGTLGLTRAVVAAVDPVPVVAAGGIADGRGLAAALMLGAAGVLMGTRFYAAREALAPDAVKQALRLGKGDDAVMTTVFDKVRGPDWPAPYLGRALRNDLTELFRGREHDLTAAAGLEAERTAYRHADQANDLRMKVVWAGDGLDLIDDLLPAAAIVDRVVSEAIETLSAASRHVLATDPIP